jgi:hypothetical protein
VLSHGRRDDDLLLALLGDYRHRPQPIREDQRRHFGDEALAMRRRLGVLGA